MIQTSAGVFFPGCADCMLPLPLIPADQDTVIRVLQSKGFDYDLLVRLRSVIDSMASSLQDGDPAKDSLTSLSDKLGAGTRAAYSTADFSDFQ